MKNLITTLKVLMTAIIIITSVSNVKAQTPWNVGGNAVSSPSSIGTTNNYPVKIKTNNDDRIIVNTNNSIDIKGEARFGIPRKKRTKF